MPLLRISSKSGILQLVVASLKTRRAKIMELETYFDFLAPDDIRVKGTRLGIETILY